MLKLGLPKVEYRYYFVNDKYTLPRIKKGSVMDQIIQRFISNKKPALGREMELEIKSNYVYQQLRKLKIDEVLAQKNHKYFLKRSIKEVNEGEYRKEIARKVGSH